MYASIEHFQGILEARDFTIFTDHKPITFAFQQKNEKASPRQLRHLDYISQFTTDIEHISGKDYIADALSRIDKISFSSSLDYELLAKYQMNNEELKQIRQQKTGLLKVEFNDVLLFCDVSTDVTRPFIPFKLRKTVLDGNYWCYKEKAGK